MRIRSLIACVWYALAVAACHQDTASRAPSVAETYQQLLIRAAKNTTSLSVTRDNLFDDSLYDPAKTDTRALFDSLLCMYRADSLSLNSSGHDYANQSTLLFAVPDSIPGNNNRERHPVHPAPRDALAFNLGQLRHATVGDKDSNAKPSCRQITCALWFRISLSAQRLYVYADGQLLDSLPVSTGIRKHETPLMEVRPTGPMFERYTSKKFPGGNYNGLGNMPYAIFIKGGYAIHGTTQGNIAKLGQRASHGCIRMHPEKAMVFFELVRQTGLENTWVSVQP